MVIQSKNNPLVKELASLSEKKGRKERGTFLLEGEKTVRECVNSPLEIVRLIVREDYAGETFGYPVVTLGADAFNAVCEVKTPQGIAAEVKIPSFGVAPPKKSCLILDGVSDPSNVGAILRTAVASGYEEVYCISTADPFSPKCVRASMSAIFFAKIMQGTHDEVFSALKGTPLIAADMGGENAFFFRAPEKFALVIGNEGQGLSQIMREKADYTVSIPMGEHTESLNAAVSAGILMYQFKK
ncbi:MAG: RNA methyltransferase [Clostridia bacterium]|nr:RNA methyltransferase [Clostridia bacterium]